MSLSRLITEYETGIQPLRKAVAGMTSEQLQARPIAGKWSTQEVVCHLCDFEPVYADRMKRVIAEENPSILGADQDRFAASLAYQKRDVADELDLMEKVRRQMARILRTLPEEALKRTGVHNERGPQTLEQLLTTIIGHVPHHTKYILEKRKALGLPPP
jgi:uncharacterized damage-inducible protein DinB